jgi:hypothetical protein
MFLGQIGLARWHRACSTLSRAFTQHKRHSEARAKGDYMRRSSLCVVAPVALVLLWASPSRADPIRITITSGHADFDPNASLGESPLMNLQGAEGFSLIAGLGGGNAGPDCCLVPGGTGMFHGFWSGSDVTGVATRAGQAYTDVGGLNSVNQASVQWVSDSFVVPAAGPLTTTVVAPVLFSGSFQGRPGDGVGGPPSLFATLTGAGIGHLTLNAVSDGHGSSLWLPLSVHVDMMAPTPEPASLMLLGLGTAGLWSLRLRRHGRA